MAESVERQAAIQRVANNAFGPGPGIGPNRGGYVPQRPPRTNSGVYRGRSGINQGVYRGPNVYGSAKRGGVLNRGEQRA